MYPALEVQVVLLRDMDGEAPLYVVCKDGRRERHFFHNPQGTWSMPRGAGMLKSFHTLDHPPSLVVIGGKLVCVGRITGGGPAILFWPTIPKPSRRILWY